MNPSDRSLRCDSRADGITALRLIGPGRGNALGPDFWRELPIAVAQINADPNCRALMVSGDGDHFSYGLDLPAMAAQMAPLLNGGAAGRTDIAQLAARMVSGFDALAQGRVPVVAAVDGWCIGAGVEMIAACDIRVATRRARFALREVKVGIVPDLGGLSRLPGLVGAGWTRRMALLGEDIDAETALRIGLVSELFDDAESLQRGARAIAEKLAAHPPLVIAAIKDSLAAAEAGTVAAINRDAARQNALLMQSDDFAEAMRAFMERREPQFRGR